MHTKEVLLGHLPGLDLYDFFVQCQQIPAHGGGEGPEPALVLRMPPSGIVERCVWMKEKPHRRGRSQSLAPTTARAFASAMRSWRVRTWYVLERSAINASHAALVADIVVKYGMLCVIAALRMA